MKDNRNQNRFWILTNYISLVIGIFVFFIVKGYELSLFYLLFEIVIFAIFFISLSQAYLKTGFWKMVHTSNANLDERETGVVLNAVKYAYSIFTIMCLVLLYMIALIKNQDVNVIYAAALLYVAHILPASIVGWRELVFSIETD